MNKLNELSIADLKAMFDYLIYDSNHSIEMIPNTEKKFVAVRNELSKRIATLFYEQLEHTT